jgi:hypothetical protein
LATSQSPRAAIIEITAAMAEALSPLGVEPSGSCCYNAPAATFGWRSSLGTGKSSISLALRLTAIGHMYYRSDQTVALGVEPFIPYVGGTSATFVSDSLILSN